jgi:hypothetical protein
MRQILFAFKLPLVAQTRCRCSRWAEVSALSVNDDTRENGRI